jgi:hypothetical protein
VFHKEPRRRWSTGIILVSKISWQADLGVQAEKVIRSAALTYSVHALGAVLGLPPFLLQGIVHGAMKVNINITSATAMLPSVLSDWAKPLTNLSDLTLSNSTLSRLGLTVANVSDWGIPLANLTKLASQYGSLWQEKLMSVDWTGSLANLSDTAARYRAAMNLCQYELPAWASIQFEGQTWAALAAPYANISELRHRLASMNLTASDWMPNMTLADLASQLTTYGDHAHAQAQAHFQKAKDAVMPLASHLPGLVTKLRGSLFNLTNIL